MKQSSVRKWISPVSLLLAFPTVYYIVISVLKDRWGVNDPFDLSWPYLEQLGIRDSLGFNINLLILFGPMLAIALNIFQVFSVERRFTREQFHFHVRIRRRWFPLCVIIFNAFLMLNLLIYRYLENCH